MYFSALILYGQDSSLKVEIKLAQMSVINNENFSLSTTLRNTSAEEQVVEVWSCGYSNQWSSDNSSVHMYRGPCMKTGLLQIRLKSGDAYQRDVMVYINLASGNSNNEPITFRLGFANVSRGVAPKMPLTWSNAVTVSVTR
jgi:hypothetical protein